MSKTMKSNNNMSVVPLSTIERVKRNVNPDKVDYVSDSQVERERERERERKRTGWGARTIKITRRRGRKA